ncbi:hypothetical protein, partial [Klebsiella variicola]|uniref:hypothetical protein n=1 Tax=Klebsiella variicola TaxID=244366 RepID=UPI002730230C
MAVRKRFRIEEVQYGSMPEPEPVQAGEISPMHNEIMSELRAIRSQMAAPHHNSDTPAPGTSDVAEAQALL